MQLGKRKLHLSLKFTYALLLWLGLFCHAFTFAQNNPNATEKLGRLRLPDASAVSQNYSYDPERDLYYLAVEIEGYPITTPLVLTPNEYDALVLKESLKSYFKENWC